MVSLLNQKCCQHYVPVNRIWQKGDVVEINLDMKATLIESNPFSRGNP
jgi:DUF1680 family protein